MGVTSRCGDGDIDDAHEACDDGNGSNADGCLSTCEIARCGDGHIRQDVEQCDDGNQITEECNYGVDACEVCAADCSLRDGITHICGDGTLDGDHEECDDNNTDDGDGCSSACTIEDDIEFPDQVCGEQAMPQPCLLYTSPSPRD